MKVQTLSAEGRFGTEVVPLLQGGAVGSDVEVQPMIRQPGESASRRTFVLVGIDGGAIGRLRGWRPDYSTQDPATLGAAIDLPGTWEMAGHPLPAGAREVSVNVTYEGDPIDVVAAVEEADGAVLYVPLGELTPGTHTMTGTIFDQSELAHMTAAGPAGWRVLGLVAGNGGDAGGGGPNQGHRQEGDATFVGLPEVIDPSKPVHIVVSGAGGMFIRPPVRTDGLVLPAIVSPDLATDA